MNSSTSIFSNWRRFLRVYIASAIGLGILVGIFIVMLDPYDTGRFSLLASHGIPEFTQSLTGASLGRQPQFNTALIGSSTLQLIDPAQIKAKDVQAVSLAMLGTGPLEQLAMAQWFLDHHTGSNLKAFVFGIDERWCEANRPLTIAHPFPFWLYGKSNWDYLSNILQMKSLQSAGDKIRLLKGKIKIAPADGYKDFSEGREWSHDGFIKSQKETLKEMAELNPVVSPPYDFAAVPLLKNFLAQLPSSAAVLLVVPPRYAPDKTGPAAEQQVACEKAFETVIADRTHAHFLNFLERDELTSNEEDFWDHMHPRARIAHVMENDISNTLDEP